jgi:aspartyl-tRNA(Asn)/glutamyl-tRNA(Gln) amidotransferase subunit C
MLLDKALVRRVARLGSLKVDEAQLEPIAAELNKILAFVEQLDEVDTRGVEPLTSIVAMRLKMREDVVTEGGDAQAILKNAPASHAGFFAVPKVVE